MGDEWTSILSNPGNMTEAMLDPLLILTAAIFCFVRAEAADIEARFLLLLALGASLAALGSSKFVSTGPSVDTCPRPVTSRRVLSVGSSPGPHAHPADRSHPPWTTQPPGSRLRSVVLATEPAPERFAPVAAFLRSEAEPGERVYHFDWGDFPELVWHAPEYRYVVGLDPHFLALEDPEQWVFYEQLSRCHYSNPSKVIRERFGARWALVSLPWEGAERCMEQDPEMELVLRSRGALLYRIGVPR